MTSLQRQRVRDLFEAALDRDPADAVRWLNDAASDDSLVRDEVRSLLDHHSRAGAFLTFPIAEVAPQLLAEEHTLEPGAVVGPYTVIREVGRGGMGRVYLASDARLGRTVALKALAPELTREPRHRDRLRREARAAAGLTHPGICTVYALEEIDGEVYIATEYLEGHTLRDEMGGDRKASLDVVVSTAREVAAALASAHAKGITHRDLKPENVMRTTDGRVKILDFGLARGDAIAMGGIGQVTSAIPGSIVGTPAYMAPEQIEGRPIGPPADVFAFGVMLYEWIAGQHPFQAGSALATMARAIEVDPGPLSTRAKVPAWLSDVVDRCMRKQASARYESAAELMAALAQAPVETAATPIHSVWWRTHQVTVILLYVAATAHAWQIKEWLHEPRSLSVFVLMGIVASVVGIVRGHLVFTDQMNRSRLVAELRRTRSLRLFGDIVIAGLVLVDALLAAPAWPLVAVLTGTLAAGIALASLLMEPATTSALLGE